MKKYYYILLLLAFKISAQSVNETIINNIKSQVTICLTKIPIGSEKSFGFDSRNDFNNCKLGDPIKVITISDNKWLELNEWRVPVILNGNYKLFFTVQKNNDTFEIVDLGGSDLAQEIQTININSKPIKYLIRLFKINIDFVSQEYATNPEKELITVPLKSAKKYLKTKDIFIKKSTYSLRNFLDINK